MPYPRAAVAGLAVPDPPDGQLLGAWHGPCNGGFPCWWYGTRLGATPRACSADARRYGTARRRFGGSASATIAALCMPANTRPPASTDGKPEISHGPGGPHHHLSCLVHGRQESARNGALPGPARSHADSTPSVMRGKGGTFFLVSRSGSSRVPAAADGPEGLFDAEVGSEPMCGPPAAVPCCCTCPETLGSGFRIIPLTCGAMGIRTPDLLHAMNHQHVHCRRHTLRQQRKR